MRKFVINFLAFMFFVASIICFYFAVVVTFISTLFNFILLFSAIYFLTQGAGLVDMANGFGKYSKDDSLSDTNNINDSPQENAN